jgi:hypothetical protein
MILYEAGDRVVCQYLDMGGSINGDGRQATIGLENSWGDSGVQYSFGSGAPYGPIENNLAILFQPGVAVSGVTLNGPTVGVTDTAYVFTATVSPISATTPIHLIWSPPPDSGQGTTATTYTWASAGMRVITVTAANVGGAVSATHIITINTPIQVTALESVTIAGPTTGVINTAYAFTATVSPVTATMPITYTWFPAPDSGQDTAIAIYTWATTATREIAVTATNAGGAVSNTHTITISSKQQYLVYLPLVMRR